MGNELNVSQKEVLDQRAEHAYDKFNDKHDEKGLAHYLEQQKEQFKHDPNGANKYDELVKHMAEYSTQHHGWKHGDIRVQTDKDAATGHIKKVEMGTPLTQWEHSSLFAHSPFTHNYENLGTPQLEQPPKPQEKPHKKGEGPTHAGDIPARNRLVDNPNS